jgi:hypothetical protein
LGNLWRCEVGGYDGEKLVFVSPCENIHGWVDNVAEIDEAVKEKTIFPVAKGEIVIDSNIFCLNPVNAYLPLVSVDGHFSFPYFENCGDIVLLCVATSICRRGDKKINVETFRLK